MESPQSKNNNSIDSIISQALLEAQQAKDTSSGVFFIEYKKKLEPLLEKNGIEGKNAFSVDKDFIKLFLNDGFYATTDFSSYSLTSQQGYMTWSEMLRHKFLGYQIDSDMLMQSQHEKALSFSNIQKLLLSKDFSSPEILDFEE